MAASHWRAEQANKILPRLQEEFEAALSRGQLLEIEAVAGSWVDDILEEADVA